MLTQHIKLWINFCFLFFLVFRSLKVITSRQIRFLGHVLRKNELEVIVLTGKIEGKLARGRQRKMFLDWVSFACGNRWSGVEILKLCQRREEHQLVANVRF